MILRALLLTLFLLITDGSVSAMPGDIITYGYHLSLHPDFEGGNFKGHMKIRIISYELTHDITFHAAENLNISSDDIKVIHNSESDPPAPLKITNVRRDSDSEQFTVTVEEKLEREHHYTVEVPFSGTFTTPDQDGFFIIDYISQETGENKWYAALSVKIGTARKVFPCIDNDFHKAPFNISVAKRKSSGLTAISGSKLVSTTECEDDTDCVWENFEEIPPLLPSSVSLVITDLKRQHSTIAPAFEDDVPGVINVYGQQKNEALLNTVVQQINLQQQYTGQLLPMTSINIMMLPNFPMSTRTAWGMILMSEKKAYNNIEVTYELLNLWFDHLITPRPNETSIRQSLSNFFLYQQGLIPWNPAYYMYYTYGEPQLDKQYKPPSDNKTKHDWLLRMLNYSLSEEVFLSGFRRFMLDRLYSIYNNEDLWYFLMKDGYLYDVLDETFTIEELADLWLGKERYPILTVTRNYEEQKAVVEQHAFIRERPHNLSEQETEWVIPIMYLTPDNLDPSKIRTSAWLNKEKEMNISGLPNMDKFIIVNPEEIGMFPVNYDKQNWMLLSQYLQSDALSEIPVLTRAKLLHDAWNIAYSGELDITTALDLTLFLPHEKNSAVWNPFLNLADHIHRHISGTSVEPKFNTYILKLLSTQLKDQPRLYSYLCIYGDEPCVAKGRENYDKWMNSNESSLDYKLSNMDLYNTFKWGSEEEYQFGMHQLLKYPPSDAHLAEKRILLLRSLAASPLQPEKTKSLLKLVFIEEPDKFSYNEVSAVVSQLSNHATGWTAWYDFLSENWDTIKNRYENDSVMWKEMIRLATQHFITQEGLEKIEALHLAHEGEFGTAEPDIQLAEVKGIQEVEWSNKNLAPMEDWLDKHLP